MTLADSARSRTRQILLGTHQTNLRSIGLAAAKAAGMKCIVTKSSYAAREDHSIADMIVDDLDAGSVTIDTAKAMADA